MPSDWCEQVDLEAIAARVGTPFYLYDAATLRRRVDQIQEIAPGGDIQARYAMKACSVHRVLETLRERGVWIDAVSGNEVLRAKAAGFAMGSQPPVVLLTADVFRDNALAVVRECGILPNIGSPHMLAQLADARYRGPVALRVNPGFGHGHVQACDTGGPSSKHGLWYEDIDAIRREAERNGYPVVLLHAHIGTGAQIEEFTVNLSRLGEVFADLIPSYPDVRAVNVGGGIPFPYRPQAPSIDLGEIGRTLAAIRTRVSERAGRSIRVELEPGRYIAAPAAVLVSRVTDIKETRSNEKGSGNRFVMIDAGFCDLVRPAMYGSYHHITVPGAKGPLAPVAIAGPLCESGDVFTRDAEELIEPRELPQPRIGDLLVLHDAGAYGAVMSSNYNSLGRAPQVWLEDGRPFLMSRREKLEDIVGVECFSPL